MRSVSAMIGSWLLTIAVGALLTACQNQDYSPKPRGYHRIVLPGKQYKVAETDGCPFRFEVPVYSVLVKDLSRNAEPCWKNLDFPQFNARLHLSFVRITPTSSFGQLTEDARTFAFKHTAKATAIEQRNISLPEAQVYGLEYSIKGNTASNYQFYVSDSTDHYLRGALYFNERPNLDSIQPVLEFLEEDIRHLVRTLRWN